MITLKGKSYRLRERGLDVASAARTPAAPRLRLTGGHKLNPGQWCTFRLRLTPGGVNPR
jgi:hypothetical protein